MRIIIKQKVKRLTLTQAEVKTLERAKWHMDIIKANDPAAEDATLEAILKQIDSSSGEYTFTPPKPF